MTKSVKGLVDYGLKDLGLTGNPLCRENSKEQGYSGKLGFINKEWPRKENGFMTIM